MPAYYYSSVAGTYTLTGAVNSSATSLSVSSVAGLPSSTPFKVVLNPGETSEEIVKVTAVAGLSLTVVRGWDGTVAVSHAAGAVVRHMITAEDLQLARTHEDATAAHGATGAVVGTTNAQTLTNKDLTAGSNVFPSTLATTTTAQALTNKDLSAGTNVFPSYLATLAGAQALSNKDLTTGNTFPSSLATLTGTQALSNKDLTAGTNTFPASLARTAGQAFTGNVTAPNLPAVATGLAGKRFAWANFTGTTNATGLVTFNHNLGYVPSVIVCSAENSIGVPKGFQAFNLTTTTITARFYTSSTDASYANSFVTADFFFGE